MTRRAHHLRRLRSRIVLDVVSFAPALCIFACALTLLLAAFALARSSGWLLFSGSTGVLCSGGLAVTRFVLCGAVIATRCASDLEDEQRLEGERELDQLQALFAGDASEAGNVLSDLRSIWSAVSILKTRSQVPIAFSIGIDHLTERCFSAIRQFRELETTAAAMPKPELRCGLDAQRAQILDDVRKCTREIERLLRDMQTTQRPDDLSAELSMLREDLGRCVAREAELIRAEERVEPSLKQEVRPC